MGHADYPTGGRQKQRAPRGRGALPVLLPHLPTRRPAAEPLATAEVRQVVGGPGDSNQGILQRI